MTSRPATARRLDEDLARALAHPLRQRILMLLERQVQSPLELAREMGEPWWFAKIPNAVARIGKRHGASR